MNSGLIISDTLADQNKGICQEERTLFMLTASDHVMRTVTKREYSIIDCPAVL